MAGACIPLAGSTTCPAFSNASISTDPEMVGKFPFLSFVSNTQQFDEQLSSYVRGDYIKLKYQQLLGCSKIDLRNTTSLYARYTTSVICNGIVQSSKAACGLSDQNARPLCADTCALSATSEEIIAVNPDICGTPQSRFMDQIRADFTVCALPADSLTRACVAGEENEPFECGFGTNLLGLCGFCAASSPNSTDSCCIAANVTTRCNGLTLPTPTSMPPLFPSSTSASTSTAKPSHGASSGTRLSGGQIAGIVVGISLGLIILVILSLLFFRTRTRRNGKDTGLNKPTPRRRGGSVMQHVPVPGNGSPKGGYEVIPGARVARMSALQDNQNGSPPRAVGGVMAETDVSRFHDSSDSDPYGDSPAGRSKRGPPINIRRNGSLSSTSALAGDGDTTSPKSGSGGQFSSPEGVASGQSEQLPFFRDYYSQDDIHPNDKVSVLWAYHPRAGDEFELERGEMLKVVGIWDDGWATGIRISERAEDYDGKHKAQRDSGVSNGSERRESSPPPAGEIKAFPLVCVCLPEHWRKTIDGDTPVEGDSPS